MKADDFETDIVEVLRENVPDAAHLLKGHGRNDFAEVFLFFDFDVHANNLREKNNLDALREMLGVFNNETELGKLYISYPMIEALRDRVVDGCHLANGHCHREVEAFTTYKGDSVKTQTNVAVKDYSFLEWAAIILDYANRVACLFDFDKLDRDTFVESVTPALLYEKERFLLERAGKVFILSCIPEFLIDYSEVYWNRAVGKRIKVHWLENCPERRTVLTLKP